MRPDDEQGQAERDARPLPPLVHRRGGEIAGSPRSAAPLPPVVTGRGFSEPPGDGAAPPAAWSAPGASEEELEAQDTGDTEFPLDAFFVPEDSERVPVGFLRAGGPAAEGALEAGTHLAERLEALARRLRAGGIGALQSGKDPLTRAVAAAIADLLPRAD